MNQKQLIISGIHMPLTDAIKETVHEKVKRLFNHEADIVRLRVELGKDTGAQRGRHFFACGILDVSGRVIIIRERTEDLYKSIDLMVDRLDRQLRRRARMMRVKRHYKGPIDIPADLPRVHA